MCLCDEGRWGLDCSLSEATPLKQSATEGHLAWRAPLYVLPLPTHWAMQHVYQGAQQPQRGMYEANRIFLERLHRHGHVVARPEHAVLFYVPVMFTQSNACATIEPTSSGHRRGAMTVTKAVELRTTERTLVSCGCAVHGCLWEPQRYLDALVDFLRSTPPFDFYWNRHRGADHVFFTTQDMGRWSLATRKLLCE